MTKKYIFRHIIIRHETGQQPQARARTAEKTYLLSVKTILQISFLVNEAAVRLSFLCTSPDIKDKTDSRAANFIFFFTLWFFIFFFI